MSDWEDAADSGPDDWDAEPDIPAAPPAANMFAGEDEEEEAPKPHVNPSSKYAGMGIEALVAELEKRDKAAAAAAKPSTGAKARRKALKEREAAEKAKAAEAAAAAAAAAENEEELSAAEVYARKMSIQKKVEDADLELAKEMLEDGGDDDEEEVLLIEAMNPKTKADFNAMAAAILAKVAKYEASPFYKDFVKDVSRDMCVALSADEVRKVGSTLEVLRSEKQKAMKGKQKTTKGKKKAQLGGAGKGGRGGGDDVFGAYGREEYDDFM